MCSWNNNNRPIKIDWKWCSFDELSTAELYAILQLRQEVFVVEQKCVYLDCDGLDKKAWHLMGIISAASQLELVAYLRVIFPGAKAANPAIGRLLTHEKIRKKGVGRRLLREAIVHTDRIYPDYSIQISAQHNLEAFYNSFGFLTVSEPYDEDGITHVDMIRST